MVDAITRFVVGKIGNYLIEEASMLIGVQDDLEDLKTELTCIQGYLKDVEAREREDVVSKKWTELVLDIAYDIEDVLDTYLMKAEQRSQRRGVKRWTNKIGKKIDACSIVNDIRNIKRRLLDVTRMRETYGIGTLKEPQGGGNTSNLRVMQLRRARSVDHEELVVGLEEDAKILLEKLLDDRENNRFMISIFGMGGLGKTALARKLYNSEVVKRRFKYRTWTYVSQEYKTGDILMRIIRSLGVASGEELEKIRKFSEDELEYYLRDLLEGKIYLVVIDDIWEREVWESVKRALPFNHGGSRVIITTRIGAVAEGVDERVYAHKLRFLTFEESWKLFEQKALRNTQGVDEDLLKIGKTMVQKCHGLPLAILVLAGLLSRKRANEWNDVCNSLWRRLKDKSSHVSTVFDLSFKEMRSELKLCFLYLSVFPEDYGIEIENLICLLVAEGFIKEDEEMMEDVAWYYIEELIDRSLVQPVSIYRGRVMTFGIHDLLRDEAIKKAKEHNFVTVYNNHAAQHSSTTCRREVVHHHETYLFEKCQNKRMRSLLFFGESVDSVEGDFETICLKWKLLRVFDLGDVQFVSKRGKKSLPDVIGDLVYLRYLAISINFFNISPSFISKLRFLQKLHAFGYDSVTQTIDLRKLTSLRHVRGIFFGELLIGDAVNLQTLRSISSYSWSKLKHESLINLRHLKIFDDYGGSTSVPVCWASFIELRNLRVLQLASRKAIKLLLKSETAVRSLEFVTLYGMDLEIDTMRCLQKLPRLEDLILIYCDYEGEKISISAQGFGRLRRLELDMEKLDVLHIEEEAMPSLIELKLNSRGQETKLIIPKRIREFIEICQNYKKPGNM